MRCGAGSPCDRNIDTAVTAVWPHMPGPGPAGVKNVKHAFTLYCEKKKSDACGHWKGSNDAMSTRHARHMAHAGELFMSCCVREEDAEVCEFSILSTHNVPFT